MRVQLALLLAVVGILGAQEPQGPTFRANTQLVQVDVVVKAKDVPVAGLKKEDFELLDNNQRQNISVFSVRQADRVPVVPKKLPPGVISNRPVYQGIEPVSATVILIDSLNTSPEDQAYARLQVLRYLEQAKRTEWIAIYHLHLDLDVRQDFTLDRDKLRASMEHFKATNEYSQPGDPERITMNGLKIIARSMQGLEGRKKLIWLTSANLPAIMNAVHYGGATNDELYNVSRYSITEAFNAANVVVYPLDPRGGKAALYGPGLNDDGLLPMRQMAEATGGKAYYLQNDIASGIEEAIDDTDLTYTLGFYPTAPDYTGQPHSIRVNVRKPGVEARYRSQYATLVPQKPLTSKERDATINAWVHMPIDCTDIPVQAKVTPLPTRPGMVQVSVSFDIRGVRLEEKKGHFEGSVEVAIVPDVDKTKVKGLRQTLKLSYTPERLGDVLENGATFQDVVKEQSKGLRVVVMDNATGKAGSVRLPFLSQQASRH